MKLANNMGRAARSRRGGVLVLSLVTVGVVASLSVAYLHLTTGVMRSQVTASDKKLAFYLAEAGLAEAYSGLMLGHTGAVGSRAMPARMGEGLFWVEATMLDVNHMQLDSTGMVKSGEATLSVVVKRGTTNLGGLGIFSEGDMTVGQGSLIDGYDSTLGDYASQAAADPTSVELGVVRSNGNITIEGERFSTEVAGDVTAGPSGTVSLGDLVTVSGATGSAGALVRLDTVSLPDTVMYGGVTQVAGPPLVVPSGTFGAQYLALEPDAEVQLNGPLTLALNGLSLGSGAELTFDTSAGDVELYVANLFDVDAGAVLTCTEEDPTAVTVHLAGELTASLRAATPFYGLIHGPDADVSISAGFELFGGIVVENLTLANGVSLHCDYAVAAEGAQDEFPKLMSWQVLELGELEDDTLSANPFDALGVDPDLCPPPSRAHEDQELSLEYYDTGRTIRTYSGPESGLDWSTVYEVISLRRDGGIVDMDVAEAASDGKVSSIR